MDIRELLGIKLPIIQAPMAGVQDHALTVAVSNAGGLGSLPCAMLSADVLRSELECIRSRTTKPYNLNFFCHTPPKPDEVVEHKWRAILAPYYRELGVDESAIAANSGRSPFSAQTADALEDFKPPVVSFHFGLPEPDLLDRVRAWGSKVLSTATTLQEALWLESQGVDAIIAQGIEAGGHRGFFLTKDIASQSSTFALVEQIVSSVNVPVIAAGGIADAAGVERAIELGASAVQLGTAYLLCHEASTSLVHRGALQRGAATETVLTNLFSGGLARGIMNRFMRECGPINDQAPEFPLASTAIAPLRAEAERLGSGDFSPLWAGQNISGCKAISAAQLTKDLAQFCTRDNSG